MKQKRENVYAFIDAQNLNLGTKNDIRNKRGRLIYKGWPLDFKKFRVYLADKFRVSKAFYFIGYVPANKRLYEQLKSFGYDLVFKPTTKDGTGNPKGNVDAELVLHTAAIQFSNYDKAVVVAGDGDYYCLHDYLIQHKKLAKIIIPNAKSASKLLNKFEHYKVFIEHEKSKLEYKK